MSSRYYVSILNFRNKRNTSQKRGFCITYNINIVFNNITLYHESINSNNILGKFRKMWSSTTHKNSYSVNSFLTPKYVTEISTEDFKTEISTAHHSKMWSAVYVVEEKIEGIDPLFVQNRRESTVLGNKSISK